MNTVCLMGNIGNDLEIRTVGERKTPLLELSIAVKDYYAGEPQTSWIDCQAWGKTAENIQRFFSKGQTIGVTGKLIKNTFTTKDGNKMSKVYVMIQAFDFGGRVGKKEETALPKEEMTPPPTVNGSDEDFMNIPSGMGDELPFN